jgi:glycosyltransferase involved in cell wall biosynthesis
MIIGIDGNEANLKNRVGVNQYAFEILWGIAKQYKDWSKKHRVIVYLKNPPLSDLPKAQKNLTYKVLPGGGVWIVSKLTPHLLLGKEKPDVFFSPHHYTPPISAIPLVCTIHDLGYLKYSEQFRKYDFWQLKYWSAWSIYISKRIISVSNSTREDIVRHYPFASKKIEVVHHGLDKSRFNQSISPEDVRRIKEKYSIVSDYLLFLGTLKPSKNIEGIVSAFALLKKEFPDLSLVIAGKKGWLYDSIFQKVESLGLKGVIFTDFVPEKDKPALIKGAKVFLIPSFWEGFGMDAVSAMATGTPVVASSVGGLGEACGEAGVVVDPNSADSIAQGVKKVLSMSQTQYNNLINKGFTQAAKFSWDKAAEKTLKVIENALKQ